MQQVKKEIIEVQLFDEGINSKLEAIFDIPDQHLLTQIADRATAKWRSATTPNHPKTAKGQDFYSESIVSSREILKPYGFVAWSENNVELLLNKEKGVAIYCCRGCDQTGLTDGRPSTLRPKGEFTLELMKLKETKDIENLDLFGTEKDTSPQDLNIWVLLTYIESTDDAPVVRTELSKPTSHYKGKINGFETRIILDCSPKKLVTEQTHEESFNQDIDFDLPEK